MGIIPLVIYTHINGLYIYRDCIPSGKLTQTKTNKFFQALSGSFYVSLMPVYLRA